MKIRRADENDINALVDMQMRLLIRLNEYDKYQSCKIAPGCEPFIRERFENRLLDENEAIMIAEDNGAIAGMAAGIISYTPELLPSLTGYIRDVWVYPEFRRRKVATELHGKLIEFFKIRGVARVTLSFLIANEAAEKLWLGLGYRAYLTTAEKTI